MKNIMVIDDEPDILLFMQMALEDHGFDTCTLDDSEDVVEALLEKKPDLMVLDYMMPKRSGITICKEVYESSQFRNLPIILVSAVVSSKKKQQDDIRAIFKKYSVPFPKIVLEKPVNLKILVKQINLLLAENTT